MVARRPFRYEPSVDCDGERHGVDHFVLDADGEELAWVPDEETGRLLAASSEMFNVLQSIKNNVDWGYAYCPICRCTLSGQHRRGCDLVAALAKALGHSTA